MNSYRTHTCSELRAANIGKPTTLIGWVDSVRDHGGVIFIDLRDRSGITQVVFHPEVNQDVAKASQQLRSEDMIQISGTVAARLKTDTVDTTNADLPTGEIEVSADTLNVINKADVLPFQLDRALSNEDLRLKYRFLDLQSAMFKALGITEEQAREQFGHILDAFSFGAPPHGGLALGLDRLVMMICNAESIREVIAFPKNNRGADLMSDSPAAAEDRQLRDIHIQVKLPAKK